MIRVFVSGCYDLLHAGHLQFFEEARELGDHLTVSFANEGILWSHKSRRPSLPDDHKAALLAALPMVDQVVSGDGEGLGLDFEPIFRKLKPDILAVTEDDRYGEIKKALCDEIGCRYVVLPKTPPVIKPISTSEIVQRIAAPREVPLRIDFAGGWLDVPKYSREGGFIVNCAISPKVSLHDWPYEKKAGLGGSGAWALLEGRDSVQAELDLGVGWQDPAVIRETGICVWKSGQRPQLDFKRDGSFLNGLLALLWTGSQHDTPGSVDLGRDYDLIEAAGAKARQAVMSESIELLAEAIGMSYQVQLGERMTELPEIDGALGRKYCGGGHGGYAAFLFATQEKRDAAVEAHEQIRPVEPWCES
ncbi:adenylyltransferase/cytidyltransferase family protein [Akkermansiaceae bacterium]|nr:adenylyltransferase/cytidyltransferase family protein [Akkermansiaceae bacterium]